MTESLSQPTLVPDKKRALNWFVYILRCADNSLYTGITTDLKRRLMEHNSLKTGAKYTRGRRPVTVVYSEQSSTKSLASVRECALKKLTKIQKEELINDTL